MFTIKNHLKMENRTKAVVSAELTATQGDLKAADQVVKDHKEAVKKAKTATEKNAATKEMQTAEGNFMSIAAKVAELEAELAALPDDQAETETGLTTVSTAVANHVSGTKKIVDDAFDRLDSMSDKELISNDADYLRLELGGTYNVMFAGTFKTLPDKINKRAEGVQAAEGYRRIDGVLKPFVNADAMVLQKVKQWVEKGLSPEKPIFCRMKVAKEMGGETGSNFKVIDFLTDTI